MYFVLHPLRLPDLLWNAFTSLYYEPEVDTDKPEVDTNNDFRAWFLFLHIYHSFMAVFVSSCMGKVGQSSWYNVESHPQPGTLYHFFHLYNGNTNIPLARVTGGSRSPHWASPAWRGLLQFLSPSICLIILTFLLTPDPPALLHISMLINSCRTKILSESVITVQLCTEDARLTDTSKVWDNI